MEWVDPDFGFSSKHSKNRSIFNFDNSSDIPMDNINWKRFPNIDTTKPSCLFGPNGPAKSYI
jgi:hypothetical protein